MMGVIIALSIRIRYYCYWMKLSRKSYGYATKTSYDTILCSQDLWDRILILKRIWRQYQVGMIAHVRISERQQEDYTAVLSTGSIKWNIDDVLS